MSVTTIEAARRLLRVPDQRRGADPAWSASAHGAPTDSPDAAQTEVPHRAPARLAGLTAVVDLLAITLAIVTATLGHALLPSVIGENTQIPHAAAMLPLLVVGWMAALWIGDGYDSSLLATASDEYLRLLRSTLLGAAVLAVGCYLAGIALPREFFVLAVVLGYLWLFLGRFAVRAGVQHTRRSGALRHRVLIVGTTQHVDDVAQVLTRESRLGYDVVGALTPDATLPAETAGGVPVLGHASGVASAAREFEADVVLLAGGAVEAAGDVRKLAWDLEHSHTQVIVAPSVTDISRDRVKVRPVGGLPLIHLGKPRSAAAVRSAKRIFDVVGASILLVAFSPLFVFAAFRIWRHDGGPIMFSHERVGRDGVPFGA